MSELKFGVFGAGFWSFFQLSGWVEAGGARPVAIYNRTAAKAEALARQFSIPHTYDDPEEMFKQEKLDFVDIITAVETHAPLVEMAAKYRVPVICQKPMSTDLASAEGMVATCKAAGVPLFIHENFRWQTPIREVKRLLMSGVIGQPFRARVDFISGFPVFANQPFLRELEEFILTDVGSHTLDVARFLFGEADSLYAQTRRIHRDIRGEDVATVMMEMGGRKTTVVVNMAYAENYHEREAFPETAIFVEGELGTLELAKDYWVRVTTAEGTLARRCPPPRYPWADPEYDVVHASIVPCNADILKALKGEGQAETSGEDNLQTVRLVFAAYESANHNQVLYFNRA